MPSRERDRSPRAVLDTNTLISAWFWEGNESRLVEELEEGTILGYTSIHLVEELRRALRYPKFNLTEDEVESIIDYYLLILKTVPPKQTLNIVPENPEDNRILECALESKADYIVSGNHHLLNLEEFRGIKIVRAAKLLSILDVDGQQVPT